MEEADKISNDIFDGFDFLVSGVALFVEMLVCLKASVEPVFEIGCSFFMVFFSTARTMYMITMVSIRYKRNNKGN